MFRFDDAGLYGKEAVDKVLKSYSVTSKGLQAIATEGNDYTKKSFESSIAHFQTLMGVKSFESAIELQTSFVKNAMEGYIAEVTKLGEMYSDLAKEAYKPVESATAAAVETVKTKVDKAVAAAAA